MMCGKPVVATDVGGVKEALGNCGIVIRPRQPEEMANALIRLLQDEQLRTSMGEDARQRALTYFTIDRAVNLYLESYLKLYRRQAAVLPLPRRRARQMLLAQRAYAFYIAGMWKEAIEQFKLAIQVDMVNPAVPVFLAEIAQAYNQMGEHHLALNELEKAKAMVVLLEGGKAA
jgi:tetratricopeptide (TPR) repeat protein